MARGHPVARVQRVQERAHHPQLQAGQLVGPMLGHQQLAQQVLEPGQHDHQQRDRHHPDPHVHERDQDDEDRVVELGGQERDQHLPRLGGEPAALQPGLVPGGEREVQRQRRHERDEDQDVEGGVAPADPRGVAHVVEGQAAGQREDRVGDEVLAQVVPGLAPAQPPHQDRGHADQRGGGAAQQDDGQHQREEAPGDLQLGRRRAGGGEVAGDGQGGQDEQEVESPGGGARQQDRGRADAAQHGQLGSGDEARGLPGHGGRVRTLSRSIGAFGRQV